MFSSFPEHLTQSNFSEGWKWADRKRRQARKANLIRRVTVPVAHGAFFCVMMVLLYGFVYEQGGSLVRAFLDQVPVIAEHWLYIRNLLFPEDLSHVQQAAIAAKLLYWDCFCLALIAGVVAAILYHPRKRLPNAEDTPLEQSRQLCFLLREAKEKTKTPSSNFASFCFLFFALIWAAVLLGFILFCQQNPATRNVVNSMAHTANWLLFAVFLVIVLGYRLICIPLSLLLRLLSYCRVPNQALAEAERWFAEQEAAAQEMPR